VREPETTREYFLVLNPPEMVLAINGLQEFDVARELLVFVAEATVELQMTLPPSSISVRRRGGTFPFWLMIASTTRRKERTEVFTGGSQFPQDIQLLPRCSAHPSHSIETYLPSKTSVESHDHKPPSYDHH
jgi:hypothetical protein